MTVPCIVIVEALTLVLRCSVAALPGPEPLALGVC